MQQRFKDKALGAYREERRCGLGPLLIYLNPGKRPVLCSIRRWGTCGTFVSMRLYIDLWRL